MRNVHNMHLKNTIACTGNTSVLLNHADDLGYDIKLGSRGWYYRDGTSLEVVGIFATARKAALHALYGIEGEC